MNLRLVFKHLRPFDTNIHLLEPLIVLLFLFLFQSHDRSRFVETRTSTRLLEKIARSVEYNEPVLLVGETGTGKTTLVQNLAHWIGQKLTVLVCFDVHSFRDLLIVVVFYNF